MEAAFGSCPLPGVSSCALAGVSGPWWSPGVPRLPPLTCGSSCFAGAAGCVATLLHDAAMNPAEGNDGPGLPGRGGSGAAHATGVPSAARRVLSSLVARLQGPFGGQRLWLGSLLAARFGGGRWKRLVLGSAANPRLGGAGRAPAFHPGGWLGTVTWGRREGKKLFQVCGNWALLW